MPVEGPTMRAPKALLIPVVALLLVASLTAQVRLLSPSQGQVLYPTRVVRIEWDNPTALPVDLRYSTDQGTTWMPIASALHHSELRVAGAVARYCGGAYPTAAYGNGCSTCDC